MNPQILRNKNIALMRLKDRRQNSVRKLLEDHFWLPDLWPNHVVNALMNFKYSDRLCVCNFFFGNGLSLDHAIKIISFYKQMTETSAADRQIIYTFTKLWERIDSAINKQIDNWHHIQTQYYYYSMNTKQVLFFNGDIRYFGNRIAHNQPQPCVPVRRNELITVEDMEQMFPETEQLNRENKQDEYKRKREDEQKLERRWRFLQSLDGDPLVIDGITFKFDWKLYTNQL